MRRLGMWTAVFAAGAACLSGSASAHQAGTLDPEQMLRVISDHCTQKSDADPEYYWVERSEHESQAAFQAAEATKIERAADARRACVERVRGRIKPEHSEMLKEGIDALIAGSSAYLAALAQQRRKAFEANPAAYAPFGNAKPGEDYHPDTLKRIFAGRTSFKTLAETCGTFDRAMPRLDNGHIAQRRAQASAYIDCAVAYRESGEGLGVPETVNYILFRQARQYLDFFARYRCSRYPEEGCIADEDWLEPDGIVTPAAVELLRQYAEKRDAETKKAMRETGNTNRWMMDVHDMVARENGRR